MTAIVCPTCKGTGHLPCAFRLAGDRVCPWCLGCGRVRGRSIPGMPNDEVIAALDAADEALTNLEVESDATEAFDSSVQAARSAINAARSIVRNETDA